MDRRAKSHPPSLNPISTLPSLLLLEQFPLGEQEQGPAQWPLPGTFSYIRNRGSLPRDRLIKARWEQGWGRKRGSLALTITPSQHVLSTGSPYSDTQRHTPHATVTHPWAFMATRMNHRSQVLEEDIQSHINTFNKHMDDHTLSLSLSLYPVPYPSKVSLGPGPSLSAKEILEIQEYRSRTAGTP